MRITDEMIYQAAEEAAQLWLSTLPDVCELPEPRYSKQFHMRMNKLMLNADHPFYFRRGIPHLRRTASAVLIAILIMLSLLMTVQAYREKVIDTVVQVFPELTQYRFLNEAADNSPFPEIIFAYIPEDMISVVNSEFKNQKYILFESPKGVFFELTVSRITGSTAYEKIVDSEDAKIFEQTIQGADASIIQKGDENTIIWTMNNLVWQLYGNCRAETLLKIAMNLSVSY